MNLRVPLFLSIGASVLLFVLSCASTTASKDAEHIEHIQTALIQPTPSLPYKVIATYEHDANAFTQGLLWIKDAVVLESSGLYGKSFVQYYDFAKQKSLRKRRLPAALFAEGITLKNHQIYILTWKEGTLLILDSLLELKKQIPFDREGWGLTHTDSFFIVSTGGPYLYFYDPVTFEERKAVKVIYPETREAVFNLNELEYIEGYVYANVWQQNIIVKIDPQTGAVVGIIDVNELVRKFSDFSPSSLDAVLNGIAWNPKERIMYITGKQWPMIFALQLL